MRRQLQVLKCNSLHIMSKQDRWWIGNDSACWGPGDSRGHEPAVRLQVTSVTF